MWPVTLKRKVAHYVFRILRPTRLPSMIYELFFVDFLPPLPEKALNSAK